MNSMTFTYKMVIAYDGTNYAGWQIQPNALTVQEIIENKMCIILQEKVAIRGSGRTDANVHAEGQVAHFFSNAKIDCRRFIYSLNALLPKDIRIKDVSLVSNSFHAQYSAISKIYHYHIHQDLISNPFSYRYSWHVHYKLDLDRLKNAIPFFLGTHDFAAFANEADRGVSAYDSTRTIHRIDLIYVKGGFRLEFEGDGFLYKMVRNLTGFLIEVARGKREASEIPDILKSKDRRLAGPAAPPEGLFLMQVNYNDNLFSID